MPDKEQNRKSHARFDPAFHFFLAPVLSLLFVQTIVQFVRLPNSRTATMAILTFLVLCGVVKSRAYSLRVQDRLIRLEERLRLASLAGPRMSDLSGALTESQWIALRFASDPEMPALAERAAREKLSNKQIKDAIQVWRPDYFRV